MGKDYRGPGNGPEANAIFGHAQRRPLAVGEMPGMINPSALCEDTIVSDLTYDLRSRAPDFVDKMVWPTSTRFACMAIACNRGSANPASGWRFRCQEIRAGRIRPSQLRFPDAKLGPAHKWKVGVEYDDTRRLSLWICYRRPIYQDKLRICR